MADFEMVRQWPQPEEKEASWGDMGGLVRVLEEVGGIRPSVRLGGFGGPDDRGMVWMKFYLVCSVFDLALSV